MQRTMTGRSIPLLIYMALAVPIESLLTLPMVSNQEYKDWLLLLDCGPILEATAILLTLFVLWSLISSKGERGNEDTPRATYRAAFIAVGIAVGWLTTAAWWQVFLALTKRSGQQAYILGKRPAVLGYYPGELSAYIGFAVAFCVFIAVLLGFAGGDLVSRWSKREQKFIWKLQAAPTLAWDLWILWIVLYRLSLTVLVLVYVPATQTKMGEGSVEGMVFLSFAYVATALTCIPASIWLANHRPRTRLSAKRTTFLTSLLVNFSAGLFLLVLGSVGITVLALCVLTLNFPGWAWSWIGGEVRWRALQADTAK